MLPAPPAAIRSALDFHELLFRRASSSSRRHPQRTRLPRASLFEELPANDEVVKRGVLHRLRIGREEQNLSPIHHVGVVKKRGQVNKAYKERVFALDKDTLEYYAWSPAHASSTSADNHAYSNRMHDISSMKGCLSTRDLKVTPATTDGVESSRDGYHFSIEDISSGKIIECACENAIFRDTQ